MASTLAASFRDPDGFVFRHEGEVYRQVNVRCAEAYDRMMRGGLYDDLTAAGLLVRHDEVGDIEAPAPGAHRILRPERVPFISHPYEWSFGQLRDAALLTLDIQLRAMQHGQTLKDASAYNVQFVRGRPIFIDTLSFEAYEEGSPWVAYRQFCQHFLAPLALMSRRDVRLGQLLRVHLDGIPLDLAAGLLPGRTKWNLGLGLHLHMHARSQQRYADAAVGAPAKRRVSISKKGLLALIDGLSRTVAALTWEPTGTEWHDYYEANNNYDAQAHDAKATLVRAMLEAVHPRTVWDLGANTGRYSRIAAETGAHVVAWDIDPACVELNYREVRKRGDERILPLLLDLTNPSPAIGWEHSERASLVERGPVDAVIALGLVHHLAIANNVPLERVASFLARLGSTLVIEFVPKRDSQVQKLLASRTDIFDHYDEAGFETAFQRHFVLEDRQSIEGSARTLYRMRGRRPDDAR